MVTNHHLNNKLSRHHINAFSLRQMFHPITLLILQLFPALFCNPGVNLSPQDTNVSYQFLSAEFTPSSRKSADVLPLLESCVSDVQHMVV